MMVIREWFVEGVRRFFFLLAAVLLLAFIWLSPFLCVRAKKPFTPADAFVLWMYLAIICFCVALLPDDEADKEIDYYSKYLGR